MPVWPVGAGVGTGVPADAALQALATAVAAAPWRAVGLSLLAVWAVGALGWQGWRRATPAPRLARALGALLLAGLLGGVLLLWLGWRPGAATAQGAAGRFDDLLVLALARGVPADALRPWTWLTHAGDAWTLVLLAVAVAAWLWRRGERGLVLVWLLGLAGNGLLTRTLKLLVDRQRPLHQHGLAVIESGSSFPSGHASGAVVAWGLLAWLLGRGQPRAVQALWALLAAAVVVVVGWSRVLLQVHHASDVLAGWLTGSAWLVGCVWLAHGLAQRRAAR